MQTVLYMQPQERAFIQRHRVAHLATVGANNQPNVIPICYVYDGRFLFTPIDAKPKQRAPSELQRVKNIRTNPYVDVVIDDYNEDWTKLAWVKIRGRARILFRGKEHDRAMALLRRKYSPYRTMKLEQQPIICISIARVTSWGNVKQ